MKMNENEAFVQQYIASIHSAELVHIDQMVQLTGKYALNMMVAKGSNYPAPSIQALRPHLLVEIKAKDPDIRQTKWVKLDDLYKVGSATSEQN